ncbi:hypothetical protein DI09_2p380 [Mitosporidium daphniae]|uniref:Uncharacterized protein n=1 Tax=Mitosporidium daphniae TaxID=1485682 RepID=A0A098VVA2_9MICR|nr:uncharacterized protein DI09_2p380 [Mitosporidium daphniae]KGG51661.1 hypothetical protein DI09_2p380 [Mitosporidium daphniae]|eukprot:XP_013238088.1 uncharacterized protein DI09_2p380 [Mitosporidium daphniae]
MNGLLCQYNSLGGVPTPDILNVLSPALKAYYSENAWDSILRTHIRSRIQDADIATSFHQTIVQPLELCFSTISMFNADEALCFSILEETVELCPATCLSSLIDSIERMSPTLQKVFSLDLLAVLQLYNAEEGSQHYKLWVSFLSTIETLVKQCSSDALIGNLTSQSDSMEPSFNYPWHYLYSQDLFMHQDPCEDVPEQKKKKTIVKDESAFISIIERLFSEASCSPFWSITIDEIPMSRAIDSLKDDEKAWVKWRASGSHGIPKYDSELQVEPVSSDSPCPVDQPSFGFVKCDYSFLGSEASGKMAKPNLSTHLSILKDEDPSDREGLFHDPVSITFMFNCSYSGGSTYDLLLQSIGSNAIDAASATSEEVSDPKLEDEFRGSEVGILYSKVMKM